MAKAKDQQTTTLVHIAPDLGYDLADDAQKRAAIAAQLAALDLTGATVTSEQEHPEGGLALTVASAAAAFATAHAAAKGEA